MSWLHIAVKGMDPLFSTVGWLLGWHFSFGTGPALKYHYTLLLAVSYTSDAGPFNSYEVEQLKHSNRTLISSSVLHLFL